MTPLILGLGVPELLIILAVVLLLFGGARLAGLGKSTGRAIKEFKEETRGLNGPTEPTDPPAQYQQPPADRAQYQQPPTTPTDPPAEPPRTQS